MTTERKGNRLPIIQSSDTSEELSLTPIETPTPEQKSSQAQSSPGTSQPSLDLENSPDFEVPSPLSQDKNVSRKSPPKSSGGGLGQKAKGKDSDPGSKTKTSKKPHKKRLSEISSVSQNSDEETGIYFLLKDTDSSLEDIVDNWIKKYTENREDALQILIQFFINLCGSKGRITPSEMRAEMKITSDIIDRLDEEIDEEYETKYPLIRGGNEWKNFHLNICKFLQLLIHQCYRNKIIFDEYLLKNVMSFLIPLSESHIRNFRHTATYAAMKLSTALVDVVVKVSNKYQKYESEKEKAMNERSTEKMDFLLVQQQELERNCDKIRRALANMFESIFVPRFRDIRSEIRGICMEELGLWMQKLPQDFLVDDRLKYIGWLLHDRSSWEVRLKCVQALVPLYDSKDLYPKLRNFNTKFKERIVNMTHDLKGDVAVEAVKIMISILKHEHNLLSDEDNEKLFELVFAPYQPLARAAGEFLNNCLFTLNEEAVDEISNTSSIQDLALFFDQAQVPGHGGLLVDSLIESNKIMKDWEGMTDLLLEDSNLQEEGLDNQKQTSLIELMFFSIKQAATGEIPELRVPKPKIAEKQKNQIKKDKKKISEHFIQTLPLLLSKYSADPEKLKNLLRIPQYFDLHVFAKFEDDLQSLLNQMQIIVESVYDSDVLDIAARTFEYLCTEDQPNFSRCDAARSTLIDKIVKKYKTTMQEYRAALEAWEEIDKDLLFNVTGSLNKIVLFYMNHDLNHWEIWDSLFRNILDTFSTTDSQSSLPDEAIKYCITSCYFSLLWNQRHLIDWVDSDSQSEEKCKVLRERLDAFMILMCNFIEGENMRKPVPDGLKEDAYLAFCDLLAIFCNQLGSHPNPLMHQLIYKPTPLMQNILHNFLQQFVFVEREDQESDEHSKMEELQKRRNFLASYVKLVIYNMIPTKEAAYVFKYYAKYYKDYGDIIKYALEKAWDISKINCALTMQYSLNILFTEIVAQKGKIDRQSKELFAVKELARKFSVFFEFDVTENRDVLIALHKVGIRFAFTKLRDVEFDPKNPPIDFAFLEILSEFTNTLLKDDKNVILQFLNKHIQNGMMSSGTDNCKSLLMYRNRLLLDETNDKAGGGETTTNPKLSSKSKKKKAPKKPELSISKVKLPRPSYTSQDLTEEISWRLSEDSEQK